MNACVRSCEVRSVLALGFGVTGQAVASYCHRHDLDVFVSESRALSQEEQRWLRERGIPFEHGKNTDRGLHSADLVVLSPGVAANHPVIREAVSRGIDVSSELEFAESVAAKRPIIAVTGTNGKGSTVTLIEAILAVEGRRVCVCGNIGTPYIAMVDTLAEVDVVVIEVSSFQLEQCTTFHPNIGVLTNLSPDHVDRHGSMEAYRAAKARMFQGQTTDDVAVLPSAWRDRFREGDARRVLYDGEDAHLDAAFRSWSEHERMNLLAAWAASSCLVPELSRSDLDPSDLHAALAEPFRLEAIGTVSGVRVINDSKSTNAASAVAALRAVREPAVLLLGGRSKGAGYEALLHQVSGSSLRAVVLYGEAAGEFDVLLRPVGIPVVRVQTVEQAVSAGLRHVRAGDALLFSPACSSFDQFANYAERGREFNRLIALQDGFSPPSPLLIP